MILFVHGFGSSPRCWEPMLELLRQDERVTSRYELDTYQYPTARVELNPVARIPALRELGQALRHRIDSPKYRDRELTLIGHSQGGLVILSYFQKLLSDGKASALRNIRQAILFATPCAGSSTAMTLRSFFATFIDNPQETTLRVLNGEVADLMSTIRERVVGAEEDSDFEWRVPIHAFAGLEDDIVPEASARGVFDVRPVPGTHSTIITPPDREDPRYDELVELLLDPGGHSHRFDIEHYETVVAIEPRERQTISVPSRKNAREVVYDNYGTLTRTVRFAPGNRCSKRFTIKYSTRTDGYVVGHPSCDNEVEAADRGLWEDRGTFYRFDFRARPGAEYCLKVEIYNGFGEGERDVHFHLDDHSHRRRMTYVLDLSKYVAAGWTVTGAPRMYVEPKKSQCNDLCHARDPKRLQPLTTQTPVGVYRWELHEVREGVIDIVWDVGKP